MQDDKVFFKIVIPNYNNMAYIKKCLDSILDQTFQDFKIIVVDDLSDDYSYELAKSYEWQYPNKMVVLRAAKKIYAGGCRNIGIDYPIDCNYCYFIDSDDYLSSNRSLQIMHDAIIDDQPDMLLLGYDIDVNGNYISPQWNREIFNQNSTDLARTPWSAAWSRVTSKKITKKFLENCMRAEDTYQFLTILDDYPKIKQIYDVTYVYRKIPTSAVHSNEFKLHRPIYMNALKQLYSSCKNIFVKKSIETRLKNELYES